MPNSQSYDPNFGWEPAIPIPFWVRSWRTLFRWRPACYDCKEIFKDKDEWGRHWLVHHREESNDG